MSTIDQNTAASHLQQSDPEIWGSLQKESKRQAEGLELIASENYTSAAVMEATGTILTNKYAEGYPGPTILRRMRIRR